MTHHRKQESVTALRSSGSAVVPLKSEKMADQLERLSAEQQNLLGCGASSSMGTDSHEHPLSRRWNAALGCKLHEVSLTLVNQLVRLEPPSTDASANDVDDIGMRATAFLAELQPTNATEAMLAAQMIATQRSAMRFITRAMAPDQSSDTIEMNVNRAVRLMRLFNEQAETMAKLKGKSGQQRVVVEHVTVNHGGQAIVGAVASQPIPGGG
jgi:hypothetical protein